MRNPIRRLLNRSLDWFFLPMFVPIWKRRLRGRVISLLYHRIEPTGTHSFLDRFSPTLAPEELTAELSFLRDQGVLFLTFADLRAGRFPSADEVGVIICFDDCFRSNYLSGLQVLQEVGVKATLFQSTAMISPDSLIWEHVLYYLNRTPELERQFRQVAAESSDPGRFADIDSGMSLVEMIREDLDWATTEHILALAVDRMCSKDELLAVSNELYARPEDIRLAAALGHEIGSDGHRHCKRTNVDAQVFEYELSTSADRLRELLGQPAGAFSFPFNSYKDGDDLIGARYFRQLATVDKHLIERSTPETSIPRFTSPGPAVSPRRRRRWLLTGSI